MKTLFECCENLEEVNLNGFEASNVEVTLNNM